MSARTNKEPVNYNRHHNDHNEEKEEDDNNNRKNNNNQNENQSEISFNSNKSESNSSQIQDEKCVFIKKLNLAETRSGKRNHSNSISISNIDSTLTETTTTNNKSSIPVCLYSNNSNINNKEEDKEEKENLLASFQSLNAKVILGSGFRVTSSKNIFIKSQLKHLHLWHLLLNNNTYGNKSKNKLNNTSAEIMIKMRSLQQQSQSQQNQQHQQHQQIQLPNAAKQSFFQNNANTNAASFLLSPADQQKKRFELNSRLMLKNRIYASLNANTNSNANVNLNFKKIKQLSNQVKTPLKIVNTRSSMSTHADSNSNSSDADSGIEHDIVQMKKKMNERKNSKTTVNSSDTVFIETWPIQQQQQQNKRPSITLKKTNLSKSALDYNKNTNNFNNFNNNNNNNSNNKQDSTLIVSHGLNILHKYESLIAKYKENNAQDVSLTNESENVDVSQMPFKLINHHHQQQQQQQHPSATALIIKNEFLKKRQKQETTNSALSLSKRLEQQIHLEQQQQHNNTDNIDNNSKNTVKIAKENFEFSLSTAKEEEEVAEDPSYIDENDVYDENTNEEKHQILVQQPPKPLIVKKISPSNKYNIYEFNLLSLDEKKSLLLAKEDKLVKTQSHLNLSLNNNLLTLPEIQHLSKQYQRETMDKVERIKKSMDSTVSHVATTPANIVMMPSSLSMATSKSPSSYENSINNKKSKYFLTKRLADMVQKKDKPNALRNDNYESENTENKEQQDFVTQEELFMSMSKQKLMPTAIKSYPTSKVSNVNEKFYLDIFIPS